MMKSTCMMKCQLSIMKKIKKNQSGGSTEQQYGLSITLKIYRRMSKKPGFCIMSSSSGSRDDLREHGDWNLHWVWECANKGGWSTCQNYFCIMSSSYGNRDDLREHWDWILLYEVREFAHKGALSTCQNFSAKTSNLCNKMQQKERTNLKRLDYKLCLRKIFHLLW